MQRSILIFFLIFGMFHVNAQDANTSSTKEGTVKTKKEVIRPKNALIAGLGSAVANGDLPDAKFDFNFQIGYKRDLGSGLNLSLTYNKFNIVFEDLYNEGFMSFDLNLAYMFLPDQKFTPYIYAGPGLNAANSFENSEAKFQVGIGLEYLVSDNIGLNLYFDTNFLSNDVLDGLEAGGSKDAYYKIGFGANYYFPGYAKKVKDENGPTFIKKNKLDDF